MYPCPIFQDDNDQIHQVKLAQISSLVHVGFSKHVVGFMLKAFYTLHNFWLSQMKDWHRDTIVAISMILAPNLWSCFVQWEMVKDDRCHDLATKDSLRSFSESVINSA